MVSPDTEFDIDEMASAEFLNSLDDSSVEQEESDVPSWVVNDVEQTTYKAWIAILVLKTDKLTRIKVFGKVATEKTPKSLYQIAKSEVSKQVGVSAQSIFRASSFSPDILDFFDEINKELLEAHKKEQVRQKNRHETGLRANKKEAIVKSHQSIESELASLKKKTTKDVLDLAVDNMALDIKLKLGL